MKLTLQIIESYGFSKESWRPDHDDFGFKVTLPNGIELSALTVCNGEAKEADMLEGLGGWICIDTKEELDDLVGKTYEEVIDAIAEENEEFDRSEYE